MCSAWLVGCLTGWHSLSICNTHNSQADNHGDPVVHVLLCACDPLFIETFSVRCKRVVCVRITQLSDSLMCLLMQDVVFVKGKDSCV
jgi:hypothetical protein